MFSTKLEVAALVEGGYFCAAIVDVLTKNKGAREASYFFVPADRAGIAWDFKASVGTTSTNERMPVFDAV